MINSKKQLLFALILILAVASRFVPHSANFVPLGAFGIFVSDKLGRKYAIALLVGAMIISDIFLGFSLASIFVYAGLLAYIASSYLIKKNFASILLATLAGGAGFYLVSNFGVFLGPWYPHTISGFVSCFTLALPFYKNTALADLTFVSAIYSLFYLYNFSTKGEMSWHRVLRNLTFNKKS